MRDVIRIGICQLNSEIGGSDYDPRPANVSCALEAIGTAHSLGAELVVFGEAFLNGYESREHSHRYAIVEQDDDPWVARLIGEAQLRDVHILIGATTRKGTFPGDLYNSALLIGPTGLVGVYNKTHVTAFTADGGRRIADERVFWSPGGDLPVFDTPLGRIGVEICYDIRFPEVARTLAVKGAELIVNVSAAVSGSERSWDHVLYTRSVENAIWYLHVSVVGRQRNLDLSGGSRLFSPYGEVVAEAPRGDEAILVGEAAKHTLLEARGTLHTFSSRQPLLYAPITAPVPWLRG